MKTQETIEPFSEKDPMALNDSAPSTKTNLMEMSREELAKVGRNLLKLWKEIDERSAKNLN